MFLSAFLSHPALLHHPFSLGGQCGITRVKHKHSIEDIHYHPYTTSIIIHIQLILSSIYNLQKTHKVTHKCMLCHGKHSIYNVHSYDDGSVVVMFSIKGQRVNLS